MYPGVYKQYVDQFLSYLITLEIVNLWERPHNVLLYELSQLGVQKVLIPRRFLILRQGVVDGGVYGGVLYLELCVELSYQTFVIVTTGLESCAPLLAVAGKNVEKYPPAATPEGVFVQIAVQS